ncbi:MAG: transposase, partial [Hyphomicrobiaceae bacterium]
IEGPGRYTSMTLEMAEFIRRFLLHVLPKGLHRIRHYGLLAGTAKQEAIAKARDMLAAAVNPDTPEIDEDVATAYAHPCPCCGGRMLIVELFEPGGQPQHQPINPKIRIDTS